MLDCGYGMKLLNTTNPVGTGSLNLLYIVLHEDIDQILPNKLHVEMHNKIGVTCVYNGHVFYTQL